MLHKKNNSDGSVRCVWPSALTFFRESCQPQRQRAQMKTRLSLVTSAMSTHAKERLTLTLIVEPQSVSSRRTDVMVCSEKALLKCLQNSMRLCTCFERHKHPTNNLPMGAAILRQMRAHIFRTFVVCYQIACVIAFWEVVVVVALFRTPLNCLKIIKQHSIALIRPRKSICVCVCVCACPSVCVLYYA